jgi:hypothetical protein
MTVVILIPIVFYALVFIGILALAVGDVLIPWQAEVELLGRMPERAALVTGGTTAGPTARH